MKVTPWHQIRVERELGSLHCRAVPVHAGSAAKKVGWARDHPDTPVPELEKMAGGCVTARPVGRPDCGHARVGSAPGVDDYKGQATRTELGFLAIAELC